MKLSIIIPCNFNTLEHHDLTALFTSLNNQVHADWEDIEIILTHPYNRYKFDMGEYNEIKPYFKAYYTKANTYGGIKQFGLEISQGDYIMFVMPNTIFSCATSIIDTMQRLETEGYKDFYLFNTVSCIRLDPETNEVASINSLNTLDGKIFNREFIEKYGLSFITHLSSGEDLAFMQTITNLNPQYSIMPDTLIYEVYHEDAFISLEEQYMNNLEVLCSTNTSNIIINVNKVLHQAIQVIISAYETLYSYSNEEHRTIAKNKIKNFILNLQNLVNINVIFSKCAELSNTYFNNEIIALNDNKTFYDFVVSIFVDEQLTDEVPAIEEIIDEEATEE